MGFCILIIGILFFAIFGGAEAAFSIGVYVAIIAIIYFIGYAIEEGQGK